MYIGTCSRRGGGGREVTTVGVHELQLFKIRVR